MRTHGFVSIPMDNHGNLMPGSDELQDYATRPAPVSRKERVLSVLYVGGMLVLLAAAGWVFYEGFLTWTADLHG